MTEIVGREIKIEGKEPLVTVPVKFVNSANAVDTVALANALVEALTKRGAPSKAYEVIMGVPEGTLREAAATQGRPTLEQLVKDGVLTVADGLYSVAA